MQIQCSKFLALVNATVLMAQLDCNGMIRISLRLLRGRLRNHIVLTKMPTLACSALYVAGDTNVLNVNT